jgi:dephospho-CoA kinase
VSEPLESVRRHEVARRGHRLGRRLRYGLAVIEIGLTGGIGSGKSTVAQGLVARGAVLIDADAIVREVQAPGSPVLARMAEAFGDDVLTPDGALDRARVAAIVFSDPDRLAVLNGIVHPAVVDEMTRRREALNDSDATVVLEIPLLVESGYENLGGIVVVDVDPDVATQRLVAHRGFSEADARARISRQASRDDRLARADFVIENQGDLATLEQRIDQCWAWISSLPRPVPGGPVRPIRPRGEN